MIESRVTVTPASKIYELVILNILIFSIQLTVASGGARISFGVAFSILGISLGFDLYDRFLHRMPKANS